jgi:hypothetical protein
MNNIYVDELPNGCKDCYCCNYCMDYGISCKITTRELDFGIEWEKRPKDCPLKPLADRLAEERKKVVQEIRDLAGDYFEMPYCDACGNTDFNDVVLTGNDLTEILDDVERGD